jgi:hypothetical protein
VASVLVAAGNGPHLVEFEVASHQMG